MNTPRLFAGILLVVIGIGILLTNTGVVSVAWGELWKLWPLVLVFVGASLLLPDRWTVAVGILLLVLAIGYLAAPAKVREVPATFSLFQKDVVNQTLTEAYDGGVEKAELVIDAGAGSYSIKGVTDQLLEGVVQAAQGAYTLQSNREGAVQKLHLELQGRRLFGSSKNTVELQLHTSPSWIVRADVGAASIDFDLSPYRVDTVEIDSGATSMSLRLGDRSDMTKVNLDTGASSVEIEVPKSVGSELRTKTALSSSNFSGFTKIEDTIYRTSNFESATKKIVIEIDAGVSSIDVSTY